MGSLLCIVLRELKVKIFERPCLLILLYGCEVRVITTSLSCYPDNYLTNCVHIIYGIKLVDRMLNFELYRLSQQRPVTTTIQVKQLRWSGNTLQHPKTNHSIYMLCTNLPRKHKGGRKRLLYSEYIAKIISKDVQPSIGSR